MGKMFVPTPALQQAPPLCSSGWHATFVRVKRWNFCPSVQPLFPYFLFHKVAESRSNYDPDPQCWPKKYSDFRSEK